MNRSAFWSRIILWGVCIALAFTTVPSAASAQYEFRVVGVRANDVLHMREEPFEGQAQAASKIVGSIPHDETRVLATGQTTVVSKQRWYEVYYRGTKGWVNGKFLSAIQSSTPMKDLSLSCFGTEPFWSLDMLNKKATFTDLSATSHPYSIVQKEHGANRGNLLSVRLIGNDRNSMQAIITAREWCNDGMSDRENPFEIFLIAAPGLDGRVVQGCCNIRREP